jgi:hypothetical protein
VIQHEILQTNHGNGHGYKLILPAVGTDLCLELGKLSKMHLGSRGTLLKGCENPRH